MATYKIRCDIILNEFKDKSSIFVNNFTGDLKIVAKKITDKLIMNLYLPLTDPENPLHRYGDEGYSTRVMLLRLYEDICRDTPQSQGLHDAIDILFNGYQLSSLTSYFALFTDFVDEYMSEMEAGDSRQDD